MMELDFLKKGYVSSALSGGFLEVGLSGLLPLKGEKMKDHDVQRLIEDLRRLLETDREILFAYLYGSSVTEPDLFGSDLDIAVYIKPTEKERILEYLDNIDRQIRDLESISMPGKEFFLEGKNSIQIKAIKYSLACAIQDITRISVHPASALSLWKARESETEAILALTDAGILPREFADRTKRYASLQKQDHSRLFAERIRCDKAL